jgi:predicted small lipoprotein YifL
MRTRILSVTVIGLLAVAALAGCGLAGDRGAARTADPTTETAVEVSEALGPEAGALAAMGFDLGSLEAAPADPGSLGAAPAASASADSTGDKPHPRRHKLRVFLRNNVLHGEVVVQTKDGPKTVVVQRGTVTAIDATTVTVKSSDGFTLTWTFGEPLHVVEHRESVQPSQVAVGAQVGIAGAKNGDASTARLIVIR